MALYSGYIGFGGPQYAPQPGQFGYAAPASNYQLPATQFSGIPSGFDAASLADFGVPTSIAQSYTGRVIAPESVQAQYQGKPAFYDANRNIYYDGHTAFYDSLPEQSQQAFAQQANFKQYGIAGQEALPVAEAQSIYTAIENPHIVLGNGTEGNLREHANALSSQYAYDSAPQYYL